MVHVKDWMVEWDHVRPEVMVRKQGGRGVNWGFAQILGVYWEQEKTLLPLVGTQKTFTIIMCMQQFKA